MPEQDNATDVFEVGDPLIEAVNRFLTPRPSPLTPRDEALLRQGMALDLACGLAASSWGEGPTVLLAHGWNSRRTHWGAFINALVDAGLRAVAVDAPAHGDSPGHQTNVFAYSQALVRVGGELGPLAGVIGHSFGAGAVAIALHRGLKADRAALISGPASLVSVIEAWGRHHYLAESEIPAFVRLVERQVGESIEALDITRLAAEMNHPVLVVHDQGDEDIPVEDGLAIAAAWPGARALITQRYGHRRILIAKEVLSEVVAFLK
ncbi:alpha/beta hydrolase [Singulisphaera sp. Ch08]|uniref:Alpha/beta hydrolase n=1 Tax=Singulisphaera sp. Ch08 TaxID=3120278 RepID=A0AAU7CKY1_9BACT